MAAAPGDGRWSFDLSASTTGGAAAAHATVSLGATIDNPTAGDLFVRVDDVTQQFETVCSGCDSDPRAGYLIAITVHSASGDASVVCGSAPQGQPETAFTLPDDRCALAEDGSPARLPVSAGLVTIEFDVVADAFVQGAPGRAVDGHADASGAARLAAFDVVPG